LIPQATSQHSPTAWPAPPVTAAPATINWGDPLSSDPGTVTEISPGNYTVTASHAYADEFNPRANPGCLNPPCTYHVHVAITDNVDGSTNRNDDVVNASVGGIAVGDQGFGGPLTPTFFGATAGQPFSKAIGSFQDDNLLARPFDTLSPNEYTVTIYWGDGTAFDHTNLPVTVILASWHQGAEEDRDQFTRSRALSPRFRRRSSLQRPARPRRMAVVPVDAALQLVPPSPVTRAVPESPTASASMESISTIASRLLAVPDVRAVHVAPPLVVVRIVPPAPEIIATDELMSDTPLKSWVVPDV
jgi:hypothetical protein